MSQLAISPPRPPHRQLLFTEPTVSGSKFGADKPVFVLTSSRASRARRSSRTTCRRRRRRNDRWRDDRRRRESGASLPLPYGLTQDAIIPTGRAINPITKTNWEGVGVKPDVAVEADQALEVAHRLAEEAVGAGRDRGLQDQRHR